MRRVRHIVFLGLFFALSNALFSSVAYGQAGTSVYRFLDLPVSAHINALGGTNVSDQSCDISFAFQNPALLSEQTHTMLTLNYSIYLADIMFGSVMYGHNYKNHYFAAGVHYIDYGKFRYATETGDLLTETFTAKDFEFNLLYAHPIGKHFVVGAAIKPIYSVYERYKSFGLAADIGAYFQTAEQRLQMGLSLRNMGVQLKGYYSDEGGQHREHLPFDIQYGISYRLKNAPLRLVMTLHDLQRWDLGYTVTNWQSHNTDLSSDDDPNNIKWYDMAFRHAIFALEIVPKSQRFYLTLSYNHRRRMEMAIQNRRSLAGFGIGAGVHIYKFNVGFGMAQYQAGNFTYQFSLSTAITDYLK